MLVNINKRALKTIILVAVIFLVSSFTFQPGEQKVSLTVSVNRLQNNTGVVQFTLYNKDGSIPDEHFEKHFKQMNANIENTSSTITFDDLPMGIYAINILHDEYEDGKIEKGWILPVEGIGFSNLTSINPLNRPSFKKAKFEMKKDTTIQVKIIYM